MARYFTSRKSGLRVTREALDIITPGAKVRRKLWREWPEKGFELDGQVWEVKSILRAGPTAYVTMFHHDEPHAVPSLKISWKEVNIIDVELVKGN